MTNLTQDPFYNYGPVFAPDGQSIVYLARVSGNGNSFASISSTRSGRR